MSRLEMKVTAYDVLDQVSVVVVCRRTDDFGIHEEAWVPMAVTHFQGEGQTDRREWVQDALIAALEAL